MWRVLLEVWIGLFRRVNMVFLMSIWLICCIAAIAMLNSTIKTQRENLFKSDMYIRRLKAVATLSGCDLSDVKDDREG